MAGLVAFLLAMPPAAPEKVFWAWFTANSNRVATIEHGHEPIAGELAAHLQAIDPDLTFEVGVKDKPRELIISAGGVKRAFPAVRRLVAAAPEIAGWTVIAFRPRSAGGLIVEFGTYRVDPAQVWFTAEPDRGKCGITLYLPGYRDDADVKNA
jgi:hypothetical protein